MRDGTDEGTTRQSLRTTLDEHHGCMSAVQALEAILAQSPDPPGPWLDRLLAQIQALRATLAEHFRSEMAGALYQELPVTTPHVAGQIDRLAAEHGTMLATADDLLARGRALDDPATFQLREMNGRAQLLVATIRRHEAEENEIIMGAYWTETGGRG